MRWTKLKSDVERFLAPYLVGRVQFQLTRYGPGVSYFMRRGWITLDQHQVANFSTIACVQHYHALTGDYSMANPEVIATLQQQGIFTADDFVAALYTYLHLSIAEALASPNAIIRAIAIMDRRLGKRRLAELCLTSNEPNFVRACYELRYNVIG